MHDSKTGLNMLWKTISSLDVHIRRKVPKRNRVRIQAYSDWQPLPHDFLSAKDSTNILRKTAATVLVATAIEIFNADYEC